MGFSAPPAAPILFVGNPAAGFQVAPAQGFSYDAGVDTLAAGISPILGTLGVVFEVVAFDAYKAIIVEIVAAAGPPCVFRTDVQNLGNIGSSSVLAPTLAKRSLSMGSASGRAINGTDPVRMVVPIACAPGDVIALGITANVNQTVGTPYVILGSREPLVPVRPDGRGYPIGSLTAKFDWVAGQVVIAAPGTSILSTFPLSIMIHSVINPQEWNAAGGFGCELDGSIDNVGTRLATGAATAANQIPAGGSFTPPGGLLLDAQTQLAVSAPAGSATNGVAGTVNYDLTI